jgi:hypothetical protein
MPEVGGTLFREGESMNLALMLLWAGDGYCGNGLRPRKGPHPEPWWFGLLGAVGGVIGGWAFSAVWPAADTNMALYAGASSIAALVVSVILQDIAGAAIGNRAQ